VVSLCRRDGHYDQAQELAVAAYEELDLRNGGPAHLSLAGMLLGNAAYAAAQAGVDRGGAAAARAYW